MHKWNPGLKIAVVIFTLVAVWACSSFPEPATDKDAALIVPMVVRNESGTGSFGHYEITIEPAGGGTRKSFVLSPQGSYAIVRGLSAGKYTLVEGVFRYDNGKLSSPWKVGAPVTLEGRSITIVPYTFSYRIYREGNYTMMSAAWITLAQDVADKLAHSLAGEEKIKSWSFSKETLLIPVIRAALQTAGLQQ